MSPNSSSSAELHAVYRIANAPISTFPFPHFFVENVFPADYYERLQAMLPEPTEMRPIGDFRERNYDNRYALPLEEEPLATLPAEKQAFWRELNGFFRNGKFSKLVLAKFGVYLAQRFRDKPGVRFDDELMLVQDATAYKLGPHSDVTRKVVTFLFYLPKDTSQRHLGTSIYLPKDPRFRCAGGPHYERKDFDRLWTMPFLPNSLFAFFKTDNSFHGVEPVEDPDCRRWLLLYDIYQERPKATQ